METKTLGQSVILITQSLAMLTASEISPIAGCIFLMKNMHPSITQSRITAGKNSNFSKLLDYKNDVTYLITKKPIIYRKLYGNGSYATNNRKTRGENTMLNILMHSSHVHFLSFSFLGQQLDHD